MSKNLNLKFSPGLSFTCSECGLCCNRGWVISLKESERERLLNIPWQEKYPELAGKNLIATYGRQYRFCSDDSGRCRFLASDNRCIIHREKGFSAKVTACKFYPLIMVENNGEVRVGAHFSCPAVADNSGDLLSAGKAQIANIYREYIANNSSNSVGMDAPLWREGLYLSWECLDILEKEILDVLQENDRSLLFKIIHLSNLLDNVDEHLYADISEKDFAELVSGISVKARDYSDNLGLKKDKLSVMEKLLLRLFAGLSSEMSVPGLLSENFFVRQKARFKRFVLCSQFFTGIKYSVDGKSGYFKNLEAVEAYPLDADGEDIIERYLKMRFFCRAYFGNEGLGLGVLHGARFLLCLYSVTVLLAKMTVASDMQGKVPDKKLSISRDNVKHAIMLVDNSFGHLSNLNYGIVTKLLAYLNKEKWAERAALFASI